MTLLPTFCCWPYFVLRKLKESSVQFYQRMPLIKFVAVKLKLKMDFWFFRQIWGFMFYVTVLVCKVMIDFDFRNPDWYIFGCQNSGNRLRVFLPHVVTFWMVWCGQNSMNSLSEWMWRYGGEREMICDIIPIFLAARSGIKLCCTAVNRPWNNHNLFHRRALETCQPGWRIRPDLHSLLYKGLLAVLESIHQTN